MVKSRGFTLIELMIVIVLIGAMAAFAFPRIGDAVTQQGVRSARGAFVALLAKTRGTAIQRGSNASLIISGTRVYVEATHPVKRDSVQRVGVMEDFGTRYKVTISPTSDTILFDARGIGREANETVITMTRGAYSQTLKVSRIGRVIP